MVSNISKFLSDTIERAGRIDITLIERQIINLKSKKDLKNKYIFIFLYTLLIHYTFYLYIM